MHKKIKFYNNFPKISVFYPCIKTVTVITPHIQQFKIKVLQFKVGLGILTWTRKPEPKPTKKLPDPEPNQKFTSTFWV